MRYNREKAAKYAQKWAFSRNPDYYNYDSLGGDCTNFVSQCLYAGIGQMNYYGWYYIDANNKSPSWTGVNFLYDFLINNTGNGPRGKIVTRDELEIGDVIQLSFSSNIFGHTLIISEIDGRNIYVCAHTIDSKNRPLSTYTYENARFIKIS